MCCGAAGKPPWPAASSMAVRKGGKSLQYNTARCAPSNAHSGADVPLPATGARLGLYEPVKRLIGADAQPSFVKNVVAGSASGGLAAVICNPTELVKVSRCPRLRIFRSE